MKAILEFTLPREAAEHKRALNGADYRAALHDVDTYIRNALKYATKDTDFQAELQATRNLLRELVPDLDDDL